MGKLKRIVAGIRGVNMGVRAAARSYREAHIAAHDEPFPYTLVGVLVPHVRTKDDARKEQAIITTTAMLCGEPNPVICSCCLGSQYSSGIFGRKPCGQCQGWGFDMMGPRTAAALYERYRNAR